MFLYISTTHTPGGGRGGGYEYGYIVVLCSGGDIVVL